MQLVNSENEILLRNAQAPCEQGCFDFSYSDDVQKMEETVYYPGRLEKTQKSYNHAVKYVSL